jgi:hypothetical protein
LILPERFRYGPKTFVIWPGQPSGRRKPGPV